LGALSEELDTLEKKSAQLIKENQELKQAKLEEKRNSRILQEDLANLNLEKEKAEKSYQVIAN